MINTKSRGSGISKMGRENISAIGKNLDIFYTKSDNTIKVGSVRLTENDLKSEAYFIEAIQRATKELDKGPYTLHHDDALFARFNIEEKRAIKLHKWSENIDILMPCWNYFK